MKILKTKKKIKLLYTPIYGVCKFKHQTLHTHFLTNNKSFKNIKTKPQIPNFNILTNTKLYTPIYGRIKED